MKSELAKAEIERMEGEGLKPTFDDIVRLNGLGLKIEAAKTDNIYAMPRVAFLGRVTFREPSIAHGVWIDEVAAYSSEDYSTRLAITAYALAHDPSELPPSVKRKTCEKAIKRFNREYLGALTIRQIDCALKYALHGADVAAMEYPPQKDTEHPLLDVTESFGCGVLIETVALALGVSFKELAQMTPARAYMLRNLALVAKGNNPYKRLVDDAQKNFFAALDEIEARLKSEKENEDGGREDNV